MATKGLGNSARGVAAVLAGTLALSACCGSLPQNATEEEREGCALFALLVVLAFNGPPPDPSETEAPAVTPAKGDVLILGGGLAGANAKSRRVEFFDASTRKFALAGALDENRVGSAAAALRGASGQSLVTGGAVGRGKYNKKTSELTVQAAALETAELYDPAREAGRPLAAELQTQRVFHTETLLKDGRVLIVGGFDSTGKPLFSADIYNPATKTFSRSGILQSRALHTATLLPDGRVFLAGGVSSIFGDANGTTEIFDPATGNSMFASDEFMQSPTGPIRLAGHTATLIEGCDCDADGKILIVGGFTGQSLGSPAAVESSTNVAMLYDPATRSFDAVDTPQMTDERLMHTATLLPGGKVLFAGGVFGQARFGGKRIVGLQGGVHDTAEIYDPVRNTMTCVGGRKGGEHPACRPSMDNSRAAHSATTLTSGPLKGQILLAGGGGDKKGTKNGFGAPLRSAELYDPETNAFSAVGQMRAPRLFPSAVSAK